MIETVPLTAIQRALRWLRAVLSAGPLPVVEIEQMAREVGIARRTLRRARVKLGVKSWPLGFGGRHALGLPKHANGESPDPAHTGPAPSQDTGAITTTPVEDAGAVTAAPVEDTEALTTAPTVAWSDRDEVPRGGDLPRDPAVRRVVLRRVR